MSLKKLAQNILRGGTVGGTAGGTGCPTIPGNNKPGGTVLKPVVKPKSESVPLSRPYMRGTVGQQAESGTVSGTNRGTGRLDALLREVGASIVHENDSQALRFEPYLAGPAIDSDRWQKALELEELFFNPNTET